MYQTHVCRDKFYCNKHTFVTTKGVFCDDKCVFVATKVSLSQQNYVCHDKSFVVTNILLS